MAQAKQKRLVSGIQPTGKMHLGNFLGAVSNWVQLQEDYEPFYIIVDLHSLTTVYEDPKQLQHDKFELAIDVLAAGINPNKAHLFYQSDIPEHAELHLILSMITPLPWLERVPTYKGKIDEIKGKDLHTYGFLGYPVLQAADILLYKGEVVPVGEDQRPHLELAREIARRFNHFFKGDLPEPKESLTQTPILPGLDGRKMSKSYNNTIPISDNAEEMNKKVMGMFTDPNRRRRTDPGNPDICPVYAYHKIYTQDESRQSEIATQCRVGEIGCVDCKRELASNMNAAFSEFREKRAYYMAHPEIVLNHLNNGAEVARKVAKETMVDVKARIGL